MEPVGIVAELWRYPVKSMLGERIDQTDVTERGFAGDRGTALIDAETGKLVSAKRPRLWARMLECRSALDGTTIRITLPDGSVVATDDPDADRRLSEALGRKVTVASTAGDDVAIIEEIWIKEKQADPYGAVTGTEDESPLIEM